MKEIGYAEEEPVVRQPKKPLKRHLEPSDALSVRMPLKVVGKKGKKQKLFIQRVECDAYDSLGFSQYHYIDKPINKAAMCFLVTTAKGQPLAFLGFLNHTFKGCSNGIKVSRFVILPHHQGKGLALPILSAVCGMLKSRGYRVFINTENPRLGESLVNSTDYRCTTFNCVNRTIKKDVRYKHRRSGTAYRVEYIGDSVHGYSQLLGRVADMRAQRESTQPKMEGKVYVIHTYYGYVTSATCDVALRYRVNSSAICSDGHIVEYAMPRARGTPLAA
jgi:GNAT superfamily N-acetyltransferase